MRPLHAMPWVMAWWTAACLVVAGCSNGPKPGVTFCGFIIVKDSDGQVTLQLPGTLVVSAVANTMREITHEGRTVGVLIRKTEYGKVTLDITFPDKAVERVKIETGKTQDILPEGQSIGIRIQVQECR
jgi:hypothetical protein